VNVPLPPRPGTWPSRLVQLATVIVVAAVAAGTFVLSYSGVHAIALQSGVPVSLARYYPGVFDAVLVIACAAAPLPGARWWTRLYTWLVILIVIGLLGAMDAVHAMNVALPRRQVAGVVAVLPWGLLLLAFSLWLTILRHFRVQQSPQAAPAPGGAEAIEARPRVLPAPPALPVAAPVPDEAATDEAAPDDPGAGPEADLPPGLTPEGPAQEEASPEAERPAEAPEAEAEAPEAVAESSESSESSEAELSGPEGPQSEALLEADPWDAAGPGNQEEAPDEVTEADVPYATGPRLRRIRSLPAAPVDDDE